MRTLFFSVGLLLLGGCQSPCAIDDLDLNAPLDRIDPHFIEYSPPEGFLPNPYAPKAAEWYHPEHRRLPEITLNFISIEEDFEAPIDEFDKSPSWNKLHEIVKSPRWPWNGSLHTQLIIEVIDGRRVFVSDSTVLHPNGWSFYVSRMWIPVCEGILLECYVIGHTPELRDELRKSFFGVKINQYWSLPNE